MLLIQAYLREKINRASTYCLPFLRSRMAISPWVLPTTTVSWLAGRESAVSGYSPNWASITGLLWDVEGSYTRTCRRGSRTNRARYFESCLITDIYLKTQRKTWIKQRVQDRKKNMVGSRKIVKYILKKLLNVNNKINIFGNTYNACWSGDQSVTSWRLRLWHQTNGQLSAAIVSSVFAECSAPSAQVGHHWWL